MEEEIINQSPDEESTDLIEMVRAKHTDEGIKKEHISDVLVIQVLLCVLILLVFAVINLIYPELTKYALNRFLTLTQGEVEEFYSKAADFVMSHIEW